MMTSFTILSINPGSTSTKIALYRDEQELFVTVIEHTPEELAPYPQIADQYEFRRELVVRTLQDQGYSLKDLSAVVGRGGILPPVKSGAYQVNQTMVDLLRYRPVVPHASNLGAIIAFAIAEESGIPAYIYDSVATDELTDIARFTGMPEIPRISTFHALNSRAVAHEVAQDMGKSYDTIHAIVAHLGGGISLSAHQLGRVVDIISDDEGPFSPERAGRLPTNKLVHLCYSGQYTKGELLKKTRGKGGLAAYLGVTDLREVERMIDQGDEQAELLYQAMAYQVAKGIGELATVLAGRVDVIILTGGIAGSKRFTELIRQRVSFIAPVSIVPGEREMQALSLGALRVLRGSEQAHVLK